MSSASRKTLGLFLGVGLVAGCGPAPSPTNLGPIDDGGGYQAQYRDPPLSFAETPVLQSERLNAARCKPLAGGVASGDGKTGGLAHHALRGERLSRNDLVDIRVADDETFVGNYVVSRDGTLKLRDRRRRLGRRP